VTRAAARPRQVRSGLPPLPPLPRLAGPACAGQLVFAEDPSSRAVLADCRAVCLGRSLARRRRRLGF